MQIKFLDFETYYDKEYSLRKMTPVEYVLDPRFECNGCAIKDTLEGNPYWLDGDQLPAYFQSLDPADTCMVTHNALFDMCIVAWRYGFVPRMMSDTMGIAKAMLGHKLRSVSLQSVARHLELGEKGGFLSSVIGMNLAAIKAAGLYDGYVAYGLDDVSLCAGIFKELVYNRGFPPMELAVMDMVLRCAIQPQLHLDRDMLALHKHNIANEKELVLARAMLASGVNGKSDLMSNEKFAGLLRGLGVEPPMKVSPVTGRQAYAFAKTDPDFIALQEDGNPAVQALVAARLGHKSTIEETRTERFISISNLQWPLTQDGNQYPALMPVPLRYSAAHTHRLGGDWKLNMQNLSRGGSLRRSLKAPEGQLVLAPDLSQIEARLVAWLCGVDELVQQFTNGDDVYSAFASEVFGFPVNKNDHPTERFVGKQSILGLGYGMGWLKFQRTIKTLSLAQTGQLIELTDVEAMTAVNIYRTRKYPQIPAVWHKLNTMGIRALTTGDKFTFGPCIFEKGAILGPNGLRLHYHDLHLEQTETGSEWVYTYAGIPKRIYGGKLLENITQFLARIIVMEAGVRIQKRGKDLGMRLALQAHDELVYCVRRELVDAAMSLCLNEMTTRPGWARTLPLAAEASYGDNYAEAK